ncbi:hypothetical protein BBF96_01410 [Anoxybacter fermentans]|uniref:HTH cro/C1-type domain-containing protein n=1 Tax=Anoxybacter fermentans TaxID=1323375 RepID=A0A3Q9HNR9_9FIRM|nr:helix-turn-helix transcriptional regulator [Anoxybacter fermentans]AZR72168.1 hypothetical protein BBF96_01410 [Anoxybacter fermentans]
MTEELKILGKKLVRYRKKYGLTLEDVGKVIGISKSHISKLENGNANPLFKTLLRIAKFMNVPVYYLFMPIEEMNHQNFVDRVKRRLEELEWDLEKLQELTRINYLCLVDMMEGNVTLTANEMEQIAEVLDLEMKSFQEMKLELFEDLLLEFGLNNSQISNIISYLKEHLK